MNNNSSKNIAFNIKIKLLSHLLNLKLNQVINIFKKYECDISNLDSLESIESVERTWLKVTSILIKCTFIKKIKEFLNVLSLLLKLIYGKKNPKSINPKKFNTIFTIAFFPNIVCGNNVKLKDDIVSKSVIIKDLILNIYSRNYNTSRELALISLGFHIDSFFDIYEKWEQFDKEYTIFTLAKQYLLNNIKMLHPLSNNETHQEIYNSSFNLEQEAIKRDVEFISDKNFKTKFNQLITTNDNYNIVIKHLYWLDIEYNLYKSPPNLDKVLLLFSETKRLMKNLVLNRKDILDEIDDVIDEEIISNVLKEDIIDEPFYYRKCHFIIDKLKSLQSASMDKNLEEFKDDFKKKLENNVYFRDLIPFFFRFVLDSLEKIHEEKEAFLKFVQSNKID